MAWNPNSSPWGVWDSEGVFVTSNGQGKNSELQKSLINNNSATTLRLDGYGVSSHRSKSPVQNDPNSSLVASSSVGKDDRDLDANGIGSSNGNSIGKIPIVTTCIGGIECFVSSNNDGRIGNVIQGVFHDNWAGISNYTSLDKAQSMNVVNHMNSLNGDDSKMVHMIVDAEQVHPYSGVKTHIGRISDNTPAKDVVNQSNDFNNNGDDDKTTHMMSEMKQSHNLLLHDASGVNSSDVMRIGSTAEEQYSSTGAGSGGSADSLTGLHLGKKSYSQDVCPNSGVKPNPNPNPRAPRKSRIGLAGSQVPCCQVEGCKLDLTSAKDYHRRHKVCEVHSKAVKVVVSSLEQRFCQQCSRFHVLAEFDEAKRSCRRRLAGHNKRRRKPQPDPLELQARLQSTFEECHLLQHPRFPRMTLWQDSWDYRAGMMWPHYEENQPIYNNCAMQVPSMERQAYIDGASSSIPHDKLPLLLFQNPKAMVEAGLPYTKDNHHHHHNYLSDPINNGLTVATSSSSSLSLSQHGPRFFSGTEITPVTTRVQPRVDDSGRALSLLSLQTHSTSHGAINHHPHHQVLHNHHRNEVMPPHQHCNDLSMEHVMMRSMASSTHMHSSVAVGPEKDGYEISYLHDDDGSSRCGFESDHQSVMSTVMQGHNTSKKTRDLMRMSSFSPVANTTRQSATAGSHGQSAAGASFQLESNSLGELHCSYGTSYM